MGFPPPKDSQISYLDSLVSNAIIHVLSDVVLGSIMPYWNAHDLWTKLQDKYDVSKITEDDFSPSTSGRDEFSTSSTPPICGKPQTNDMVSSDGHCNVYSEFTINDPLSLSHCNASSKDLNTSSTINALHACVDSPCISCRNCMNKSHDDMLAISCCHDQNACVSSSPCASSNVEEIQLSIKQDINLSDASTNGSSSSTIFCLMAKSTSNDDDDDNNDDVDNYALLDKMKNVVLHALRKNANASTTFINIMSIVDESKNVIDEYEDTIEKMEAHARDYANDIADFSIALEEEQSRRSTLEETLMNLEETNNLEMSKLRKDHDHAQALAKIIKTKNSELVVENVRLLENNEKLEKELKALEGSLANLTKSHDQLQAQMLKELPTCSPIAINDDACATNSTSC